MHPHKETLKSKVQEHCGCKADRERQLERDPEEIGQDGRRGEVPERYDRARDGISKSLSNHARVGRTQVRHAVGERTLGGRHGADATTNARHGMT